METADVHVAPRATSIRLGFAGSKLVYEVVVKSLKLSQEDIEGRPVVVTSIMGRWGRLSHLVISIEGSPPRGNIIVDADCLDCGVALVFCDFEEVKRLRGPKYKAICELVKSVKHYFDWQV